jgi:hypothetical protein
MDGATDGIFQMVALPDHPPFTNAGVNPIKSKFCDSGVC